VIKPNGFTLVELSIVFVILGILAAIGLGVANGDSIVPSKQACMNAGGKWSEGIQYGRITQLCTYN
jgi:prepilin-type N-terminal cleavage/methylation domain-containing protein